jgi:RimJ/RimL family protein N-acetyltransferase
VTVFRTERLTIRRWAESDLDRIFDIYSRWDVQRWLGATPRVMESIDDARAALERWTALTEETGDRFGCWAIEPDGGPVAGSVLFKLLPNSDGSPATDVEVGWHLHPDSWGRGYATEAARGAMDRGFDAGTSEIFAVVFPDNAPSLAVCRRLGMTSIGRTDRWYGVEVEAFRQRPADRPEPARDRK